MLLLVLVAAAAFIGGFLRWALSRHGSILPNSLACLVAGVLIGLPLSPLVSAILITGFCGSLSTWSTLSRELGSMIRERRWVRLLSYGGGTLVLGVSLVWLGSVAAVFVEPLMI
ncbi:fluoride efflux transporter FluC [Corynebacterium pacaense]|uniref:fluoride efflux transporter FluC n=1 Tax=Corynebacterium pacaense TaxID=1816684 RepID=UPI0009BB3F4F|nr:CrcB family protein [Corynebacterium pacaense]